MKIHLAIFVIRRWEAAWEEMKWHPSLPCSLVQFVQVEFAKFVAVHLKPVHVLGVAVVVPNL